MQNKYEDYYIFLPSHPLWVCGLKYYGDTTDRDGQFVTPFMGVWIEISQYLPYGYILQVTPFMGVWIEIFQLAVSEHF